MTLFSVQSSDQSIFYKLVHYSFSNFAVFYYSSAQQERNCLFAGETVLVFIEKRLFRFAFNTTFERIVHFAFVHVELSIDVRSCAELCGLSWVCY